MPDDDLEQITDQNDFHVTENRDVRGAKLGQLSKRTKSKELRLKLLIKQGNKRKNKITLPNQQNQP